MRIGEKIKKFRISQSLSQKQLAIMCGMSEPAIRNYELGNRNPSEKQIEKIAGALGISPYALLNPDLHTYNGLIHTLFQTEDMYGIKPQEVDGQVVLAFDKSDPSFRTITDYLLLWNEELKKLKEGCISQEEYDIWRYSFPKLQADKEKQKRRG